MDYIWTTFCNHIHVIRMNVALINVMLITERKINDTCEHANRWMRVSTRHECSRGGRKGKEENEA